MAGKKLATNVYVDGQWYGPGYEGKESPPADVAKQIQNDGVWEQTSSSDK